jgi:hypothetical protein
MAKLDSIVRAWESLSDKTITISIIEETTRIVNTVAGTTDPALNPVPASPPNTAPATATGQSNGGLMASGYNMGGKVKYAAAGGSIFKSLGTDIVPAMLTPGEFVVRKFAVDNFGVDRLKAINSGTYSGDPVYNYNVSVNVNSNSDANDIATAVMTHINRLDSRRMRSYSY